MTEQTAVIAIMNDYPKDKYNLLVPVKSIQELSPMHKIMVNQVQIDPDYENGADVYVQTKGYNGSSDKLALTKTGLSKLMTAAGISIISSKSMIPSTHLSAIEMAKAIGQIVPYDTRDVAHEVTIRVPDSSGQYHEVKGNKEFIIEELKAEYLEQKKNMEVWENKKKRPATDEEKNAAVEKQLTQFIAHKRAQCETKALNRALRQAMGIKSTYTAEELKKPFVVAHVVPNLADPDLKKAVISKYAQSASMLFDLSPNIERIDAPANAINETALLPSGETEDDIPHIDAEIVEDDTDGSEESIACEKCKKAIEEINEEWTVEKIVEYSKEKFKGKILCPDCQRAAVEASKKRKAGGK